MHKYLRAIGFSEFDSRKKINALIEACLQDPTTKESINNSNGGGNVIFCKDFAPNIGIAVYGEFDEENKFMYDYYYPYIMGKDISSFENISIERHAAKESYAGICDEIKLGITLIFFVENMMSYLIHKNANRLPVSGTSLSLAALSDAGLIMMPIVKNPVEKEKIKNATINRNHLIEAARRGDEEAIESLTLEDMDTYSAISKKILVEDLYTLVDTSFMPYGVECDQYSIVGEIIEIKSHENWLTKEELIYLTISCNEVIFDVCINRKDLLGEPQIGRRFKGNVWLQGHINYPEQL